MTTLDDSVDLFSRKWKADPDQAASQLNRVFGLPSFGGFDWTCISTRPSFRALGTRGDEDPIELEWCPGKWVTVRVPRQVAARSFIQALAQRILTKPFDQAAVDALTGDRIYEWNLRGITRRWRDLPAFPAGPRWGFTGGAG